MPAKGQVDLLHELLANLAVSNFSTPAQDAALRAAIHYIKTPPLHPYDPYHVFDIEEKDTEDDINEETCQGSMDLLLSIGVNPTDSYIQECQSRLHEALRDAAEAIRDAMVYTNAPTMAEIRPEAGDINLSGDEWDEVIKRLLDKDHREDPGATRLADKIQSAIQSYDGDACTIHFRAGDYGYINDVCEELGYNL